MDRLPRLIRVYFSNYKRVVYLAQSENETLKTMAREHADFLSLEFEYHYCGETPLSLTLKPSLAPDTNKSIHINKVNLP